MQTSAVLESQIYELWGHPQVTFRKQQGHASLYLYMSTMNTITKWKHFFGPDLSTKQIHCKRARLWHSSFNSFGTGPYTSNTLPISTKTTIPTSNKNTVLRYQSKLMYDFNQVTRLVITFRFGSVLPAHCLSFHGTPWWVL